MRDPMSLAGKTLFITGASRGIGRAIGLKAAQHGANVIVAAKTDKPHPKLPGTIHDAAEAMENCGGKALPIALDIRDADAVSAAVRRAAEYFGGIDILVNNASAINLSGTLDTPMKRFDLMFAVNVRGTYVCSRACIPYLKQSAQAHRNPHILTLAPPVNLDPKWFERHAAYTISKYGMSMCVLGMAEEFRKDGIAVNALWPRTVINTAALAMIPGLDRQRCREPGIVADAAYILLRRPSAECTGHFFIDEEVLRQEGTTDFAQYAANPNLEPLTDIFID